MKRTRVLQCVGLAGATIAASVFVTIQAASADVVVHEIRQDDLIAGLSDTRANGTVEFLKEGLRVVTGDNTASSGSANNKAAEYFEVTGSLPDAGSIDWTGTQPQASVQLVFDADNVSGNGNDYNILVGEPVYGANWWLTGGSSAAAKAADPSGAENGGNGSEWFGTLAQWKAALPDATMYASGFSLGSGVKGQGLIRSITLDNDQYLFTDDTVETGPTETATVTIPGPTVTATATATATVTETVDPEPLPEQDTTGDVTVTKPSKRVVKAVYVTDPQPEGTRQGAPIRWLIYDGPSLILDITQDSDERDVWKHKFGKKTGTHVLTFYKAGELVKTVKVYTGKK